MTKPNIAIIGGGVAGLTAAVYASRANASVTIFEKYGLGGLTATIDKIENFPTYNVVNGFDLTQNLANQVKLLGANIVLEQVLDVKKQADGTFEVVTNKQNYLFDAVIVATGTKHGKLGIESNYVGKGVSYCATCDGNFYRNADVAVVGNTNSAVKEALYLAGLCKTVYLIYNGNLQGDEVAIGQLKGYANVQFVSNSVVTGLVGDDFLEGAVVHNVEDGTSTSLAVEGLFVAVGSKPETEFLAGIGAQMVNGFVMVDDRCQTSVEGLFGAGDVTNGTLKQIVTACGDGAKAGSFAVVYAKKLLASR
ncbi:MAG: FAD-dependent oxidoreductase [Clostridia bacterium]|nr:FAD-dependent oxidoreductase [Clostridia bacterium]